MKYAMTLEKVSNKLSSSLNGLSSTCLRRSDTIQYPKVSIPNFEQVANAAEFINILKEVAAGIFEKWHSFIDMTV